MSLLINSPVVQSFFFVVKLFFSNEISLLKFEICCQKNKVAINIIKQTC